MASYLGLDLGTLTGYALLNVRKGAGHAVLSGTWDFKPTRFDSPSVRYMMFAKQLTSMLALSPEAVFYEKVHRHKGTAAAHVYGGFLQKLQELSDKHEIPFVGLSVQEIKKYAAGKGNAAKEDVTAGMKLRGYSPKDDNEADAIAIVLCGWETWV